MATYYVHISPYAIWKRPFHVDFIDIYDISPLNFIQMAIYIIPGTFFIICGMVFFLNHQIDNYIVFIFFACDIHLRQLLL